MPMVKSLLEKKGTLFSVLIRGKRAAGKRKVSLPLFLCRFWSPQRVHFLPFLVVQAMDTVDTVRTYVGNEPFDLHPRYQNLEKISEGSYGFVVAAEDTET